MSRRREPKWLQSARLGGLSPKVGEKPDWISRALSRAGVLPLREAEAAIRSGRVTVEGRPVEQPLTPYRPGQRVRLDGHEVSLDAPTHVLMFHKPKGCVTSASEQNGAVTVFDRMLPHLPTALRSFGWHAVGRLDRDTTGLLLFTNDERFVTFATAPATHLPKRYVATVHGQPDDTKLEPLRRGIVLDDGPARPAQTRWIPPAEVELTLTEGRNHQVKRMLGAVGLPVRELRREAVGQLQLDVPEGQLRVLTDEEVLVRLGFSPK